jgi:hypothetical protein
VGTQDNADDFIAPPRLSNDPTRSISSQAVKPVVLKVEMRRRNQTLTTSGQTAARDTAFAEVLPRARSSAETTRRPSGGRYDLPQIQIVRTSSAPSRRVSASSCSNGQTRPDDSGDNGSREPRARQISEFADKRRPNTSRESDHSSCEPGDYSSGHHSSSESRPCPSNRLTERGRRWIRNELRTEQDRRAGRQLSEEPAPRRPSRQLSGEDFRISRHSSHEDKDRQPRTSKQPGSAAKSRPFSKSFNMAKNVKPGETFRMYTGRRLSMNRDAASHQPPLFDHNNISTCGFLLLVASFLVAVVAVFGLVIFYVEMAQHGQHLTS